MAKGSLNAVMRGKKGNTVFYKVTGSNNNDKQGSREYVATVANPQTTRQAAQRMKMAPAVNFYRAFKSDILDHSFQGTPYGARSQARFNKLALKMVSGFPYIEKGDTRLYPGQYQMAEGSLAAPQFSFQAHDAILTGFTFNATFGTFCQGLIAAFPYLHNGDQLTWAMVIYNGENFPYVARIILDTESTETTADVFAAAGLNLDQDGVLKTSFDTSDMSILGACLIVSRPSISNKSQTVTWERSDSVMQLNSEWASDILDTFVASDAYEPAKRSYEKSQGQLKSPWYLNQGTTGF